MKTFHYTTLRNTVLSPTVQHSCKRIKTFKVRIDKRIKYIVEFFYYERVTFVKFHPKLYEENPDKYQMVGVGIRIRDIRTLLNTICRMVHDEIKRDHFACFAFIGQWYEKDNRLRRYSTKRFQLYVKQVVNVFDILNFNHIRIEHLNFYCISKMEYQAMKNAIRSLSDLAKVYRIEELMTLEQQKAYSSDLIFD